jgi:hypothetical protein
MSWSNLEMNELKTGDKRLDKRVKCTVENLARSSESSFPSCFKTRAELVGAYRLFDNDFVTPEKTLSAHYKSTAQRAKTNPVVLLLNDTSSLDFTSKKSVNGLGMLEVSYTRGLFLHPTLAITPDRCCLGLTDCYMWAREGNKEKRLRRKQLSIEEKESFRWLESYRKSAQFAQAIPDTNFVYISDRESDILELLAEGMEKKQQIANIDILIRAMHDRMLRGAEKKKLKETITQTPVMAEIKFWIAGRGGQKSREVTQVIRAKQVTFNGKKIGGKTYPAVTMNAVYCIEENPPKGVEPVYWHLLTTLPIDNLEQIQNIIDYYLCRWEIEIFFNVLKNGCRIEDRGLKTATRLKNMIALFMIVAWRVMFLMNLGRQNPNRPCDEVFETAEWMSVCSILRKTPPKKPPPLGEFMIMIGRLGGYLQRKSPPGVKVIWEGLKRMADYALMWETMNAQHVN